MDDSFVCQLVEFNLGWYILMDELLFKWNFVKYLKTLIASLEEHLPFDLASGWQVRRWIERFTQTTIWNKIFTGWTNVTQYSVDMLPSGAD